MTTRSATCLTTLSALALILTGCSGKDGVWVFKVFPSVDNTVETSVDHNYKGAMAPDGPDGGSDWTFSEEFEGSPQVVFGTVMNVAGEDAKILVVGDQVYYGNPGDAGWVFIWNSTENSSESASHPSGYTITEQVVGDVAESITLDFKGNTATGTFEVQQTSTHSYTESDAWDYQSTGQYQSGIPADQHLVSSSGHVENEPDSTDCEANPCSLSVTTTRTTIYDVEAAATGASSEDYGALEDAGRNEGLDDW